MSSVLPPTAHTHVEEAITKVTEVIDRDQRVRAVTQATREMLTAQDDRLILEADVSLERANPYIADRCRALIDGPPVTVTALGPSLPVIKSKAPCHPRA